MKILELGASSDKFDFEAPHMDGLTTQDKNTIRDFLKFCLQDGFYAFEIEGKTFLLQSDEDVETIATAILGAEPPVWRYRLDQAKRAMEKARHQSPLAEA